MRKEELNREKEERGWMEEEERKAVQEGGRKWLHG
jgi:hypothetical protein